MKFKNKITGSVEIVTNKTLIEQYKKYTDRYELVEDKKATKPTTKPTTKETE